MRRGRENVEKGNSLRVFTFTGVVEGRRVGFPRFSSLSPRNLNRSEMVRTWTIIELNESGIADKENGLSHGGTKYVERLVEEYQGGGSTD